MPRWTCIDPATLDPELDRRLNAGLPREWFAAAYDDTEETWLVEFEAAK